VRKIIPNILLAKVKNLSKKLKKINSLAVYFAQLAVTKCPLSLVIVRNAEAQYSENY